MNDEIQTHTVMMPKELTKEQATEVGLDVGINSKLVALIYQKIVERVGN